MAGQTQHLHASWEPTLAKSSLPRAYHFPNPLPDFLAAANVSWQMDIWRQLRNARDAAVLRYFGTIDGRNYVVTRLVAEIAENYYKLMGLDKRIEDLDGTIALQEQSLEMAKARSKELPEAPSWVSSVSWPRFAGIRAKS